MKFYCQPAYKAAPKPSEIPLISPSGDLQPSLYAQTTSSRELNAFKQSCEAGGVTYT